MLLAGLLLAFAATPVGAEVVQQGGIRVGFEGELTPRALPRTQAAPVKVAVKARIGAVDATTVPRLRSLSLAINRYGRLDTKGLPVCRIREIQPATTRNALRACRDSLVGKGSFKAKVRYRGQAPFPSSGVLHAFNGRYRGKPAILAHVFGTEPVPTSFTLPFAVRSAQGTFGTFLDASLPRVTGDSSYITEIALNLERRFRFHGRAHSYLSASCPAPKGAGAAVFPFARARFGFAGGKTLSSVLVRTCRAKG
jgi:hypothetical protein